MKEKQRNLGIPNYYEILNIPINSSRKEIKEILDEYKKKVNDRDIIVIQAAEEYLIDHKERYDKYLKNRGMLKNKSGFKIVKENESKNSRNVNTSNLRKKIITVIIGGMTLAIAVGTSAAIVNSYEKEADVPISYSEESTLSSYMDASSKYSFRYEVVYGDTLSEIAERFGVTKSDIKRESNTNILNEGETLYIITSDKELADAQNYIYNQENNSKSR